MEQKIDWDDAMEFDGPVTVWLHSGGGQQGEIVADGRDRGTLFLKLKTPLGDEIRYDAPEVAYITADVPLAAEDCLEYGSDGEDCGGPVELHLRPSDWKSFPRCERHQAARERSRRNSMERYADSDVPPSWFDPSYAGERWEDD